MKEAEINKLVAQYNKLYITYRKQFLQQTKDTYITQKYTLSDYQIKQHLLLKKTVGVKLGPQGLASFLAFDVDYADNPEKAQQTTVALIKQLHEYWGIPLAEIHCDFSGSKGYHVTLFFDEVIQDTNLRPFYDAVIDKLGVSIHEVEFRCSRQYGMKLPLGINQKSKKFMCFVSFNPLTEQLTHMSKAESYNYFLDIEQSSTKDFRELILSELGPGEAPSDVLHSTGLTTEQAEQTENVLSEIDTGGKSIKAQEDEIKAVILNNRLLFPGTRDIMTHKLSMFYRDQGYDIQDTRDLINEILLNTYENYRPLISADTTIKHMLKETDRITTNTYTKGYTLTTRRKDIVFYKDEVLFILNLKQYHLKKLAFSLLLQSKRYSHKTTGVFFTAHSTLTRMGNTGNKSRLLEYIQELESLGVVEIVSRNQIDEVQTKIYGTAIKKPNTYKMHLAHDVAVTESLTIQSNSIMTLEQVTAQLINKWEAKKILPRRQWESHFIKEYVV